MYKRGDRPDSLIPQNKPDLPKSKLGYVWIHYYRLRHPYSVSLIVHVCPQFWQDNSTVFSQSIVI